jgi:hypothetical protein
MTIPVIEPDEIRDQVDVLELEIRRVPGVTSVSIAEKEGEQFLSVVVPSAEDEEGLRTTVAQLVRTYSDTPFTINIDNNSEKTPDESATAVKAFELDSEVSKERSRPQLVELKVENEVVSVDLQWRSRRGLGESSARTLNHAAEATLLALDDLGTPVPFYVRSVTPLGAVLRDAVVVVLRSNEAAEERFGVATGESAREATARATLDALNRYVGYRYGE